MRQAFCSIGPYKQVEQPQQMREKIEQPNDKW